jgi:hypothetical protein
MIEASRSAIYPAEAGNDSMPLRSYLTRPSTLPLGVGLSPVNYTLFVFISRMPGYFTKALHLDIKPMSVLSAVPWAWWRHRLLWRRPDPRRLLQAHKGQAARSRRRRQMLVARHCMKAAQTSGPGERFDLPQGKAHDREILSDDELTFDYRLLILVSYIRFIRWIPCDSEESE